MTVIAGLSLLSACHLFSLNCQPKYKLLMKIIRLFYFFSGILLIAGVVSCGKNNMSEPAGGDLPTNYIMVKDSSFTPSLLTVVSGSSITFVNNTGATHTVMTDDSTTIRVVSIVPGTS